MDLGTQGGPEQSTAERWVENNVKIDTRRQGGGILHIDAVCQIPIEALPFWQLVVHPQNYEIFRSIQRCTYRKVLANNGHGHHLVEVENESDWHVLFVRGAVRTRMLVEQDMNNGTMHFTLAPKFSSPMRELYGRWHCVPSPTDPNSCLVTLYQRFAPRSLPPFLFPAFARFAVRQIRSTFEDLMAEVLRIKQGRPSLPPYMSSCMKELVNSHEGHAEDPRDPASVLAALEEASSASTGGGSSSDSGWGSSGGHRGMRRSQGGSSGASMAASSRAVPASHALSRAELAAHAREEEEEEWKNKRKEASGTWYDTAVFTWRVVRKWVDDHMPLEDDVIENASLTSGNEDLPRNSWLVVA